MVRMRTRLPGESTHRRGGTIIIVIAFFAVAMALMGSWIRSALNHQRQVRRWHQDSQVVWLAESGVRRAVAQLAKNQDYREETWQIAAAALGATHKAEVDIVVEAIEPTTSGSQAEGSAISLVRITAVARYPTDHSQQNKQTKSIEIELPVNKN